MSLHLNNWQGFWTPMLGSIGFLVSTLLCFRFWRLAITLFLRCDSHTCKRIKPHLLVRFSLLTSTAFFARAKERIAAFNADFVR
jgi:hypothetical protein